MTSEKSTLQGHPSGFVTFVFTDIKGSAAIQQQIGPTRYQEQILHPVRALLKKAAQEETLQGKGFLVQSAGDGAMLVFQNAADAVVAITRFQQALMESETRSRVRFGEHEAQVRIGIHTSTQQITPTIVEWENPGAESTLQKWLHEYADPNTDYAARLGNLGDGGQILVSNNTRLSAANIHSPNRLDNTLNLDNGDWPLYLWDNRYLKSISGAQDVYEILYLPNQAPREPGIRFFPDFYVGEKNRYIERKDKQREVLHHFETRQRDGRTARLVTIKAEGGMGKTRLAVACAVRLVGAFDDGVYFVNLARDEFATDAAARESAGERDIAAAIALALNRSGPEAEPEAIFTYLKDKNILLLLDNYECFAPPQSDDPDAPNLVGEYLVRLAELRGVCLLVTGRVLVGVDDIEQLVHLEEGLSHDEGRALFLARAALKWKSDRVPTADEEIHLNCILQETSVEPETPHSGGIPLAIELAAAWVDKRTLQQIADEIKALPLGDMARAAGMRADDAATFRRHRSLTRSLDWSYNILGRQAGAAAQRAFAVCGLFASSFATEILAAITQDRATQKHLDALLDASLVRRNEETGRYRLHRFTRAYARQKLSDLPDGEALTTRFLDFYVQLATENDNINDAAVRALLDAEWRNVLGASEIAAETAQHEAAVYLINVQDFLRLRGYWRDWETLCQRALDAARALSRLDWVGMTLNNTGAIYRNQGRYEEALEKYEASLLICQELGDRLGEGQAFNNMGIIYRNQGHYEEALEKYEASLLIWGELKARYEEGTTLNNMGIIYQNQGRYEEALEKYEASLLIWGELKARYEESATLNNMGIIYGLQGRYDEALEKYEASLLVKRELGNQIQVGRTLYNVALLWHLQNEDEKALDYASQSVAVLKGTEAVRDLELARQLVAELENEA